MWFGASQKLGERLGLTKLLRQLGERAKWLHLLLLFLMLQRSLKKSKLLFNHHKYEACSNGDQGHQTFPAATSYFFLQWPDMTQMPQ